MALDVGAIRWSIEVDPSDLDNARISMERVGDTARKGGKDAKKFGKDFDQAGNKVRRSSSGAASTVRLLTRAVTALGVAFSVREVIQYADAWQSVTNQLKTVQKDGEDLASTQKTLIGLANETRSSFESTANLYTRLSRASESLGLNQQELVGLTSTINKSFAVSGATAQEASNAITQLSQGLAAGALRGEEFNSVSEQSPILMQAIADKLQMTRGELREFAAEGGITAEIVIDSLRGSAEEIDQTFSKMSATFGQNMTVARNNLLQFVGDSEAVGSAVGSAGELVVMMSNNIDLVGQAAALAGTAIAGSYVPALLSSAAASLRAAAATNVMHSSLATLPTGAAAAATAIGLVALALIRVRDRVDEARESMFRLHTAGIRSTELRMAELAKEILSANRQLEALERLSHAGADRIQEKRDRVEELVAEMERLAKSLKEQREAEREAGRATADSITLMDAHVQAMLRAQGAASALTEEQKKNRDSVADLIRELEIQSTSLDMTARSAAVYQAVMQVTARDATPEMISEVARLTATIWDQQTALESTAETAQSTSKDRSAAEEAAARASMDNWQRTHEFVTDTILDIADQGGNAFEQLGDIAVNTAKRIAAEWLALKAMNLFGFEAPAGALAGGGMGGGLSGMATSAAMNMAGIGAGSFSLGAIGTTTGGWVAPSMAAPGAAAGAGSGGGILASMAANPLLWGAGALIGGSLIHNLTNDPDGRQRGMAGFLAAPTPGAPRGSQFNVDPFASGFAPTGFADGPMNRSQAEQLIDQFRFLDETIVEAVTEAGGRIARPGTLGGFGLEGTGAGTFFGMSDITTEQQFNRQLDSFASQLADHIEGLTPETMAKLAGASSAQEIVNILGEVSGTNDQLADRVTSLVDSNDFVVDSQGSLIDSNGAVVATMQQLIAMQGSLPAKTESALRKAFADANKPAAAKVNQAVAGRDPGMVFGEMGDPGTHFVDGVQVNPISFAESKRRERVADNIRMSELGYNFQTGEWDYKSGESLYYNKRRFDFVDGSHRAGLNNVPFDGYVAELHQGERVLTANEARGMGGMESEMGQLMRAMVKQAARTAKILERWEGDGLPTERT